jgi:transcriptional antiterminator RfaH
VVGGRGVESSPRRDDPPAPSPPTKGGEGRGEEACLPNSETPLPNPLPVRTSRGEGEDRRLPAARLNSTTAGAVGEAAGSSEVPAWFCIRTQPKHEHIAAAHLKEEPDIEVYLPRIRFKRSTRRGPVWFTEALFPNYLFARFDLAGCLRKLHHHRGVRGVVHFGQHWPTIPDGVIDELRASVGADEVHVIGEPLQPGETVQISGGGFHGLTAVVSRVMPGSQRVAVLMEFLGRQTTVELASDAVIRAEDERKLIL